jgi:hypothetical protein
MFSLPLSLVRIEGAGEGGWATALGDDSIVYGIGEMEDHGHVTQFYFETGFELTSL